MEQILCFASLCLIHDVIRQPYIIATTDEMKQSRLFKMIPGYSIFAAIKKKNNTWVMTKILKQGKKFLLYFNGTNKNYYADPNSLLYVDMPSLLSAWKNLDSLNLSILCPDTTIRKIGSNIIHKTEVPESPVQPDDKLKEWIGSTACIRLMRDFFEHWRDERITNNVRDHFIQLGMELVRKNGLKDDHQIREVLKKELFTPEQFNLHISNMWQS